MDVQQRIRNYSQHTNTPLRPRASMSPARGRELYLNRSPNQLAPPQPSPSGRYRTSTANTSYGPYSRFYTNEERQALQQQRNRLEAEERAMVASQVAISERIANMDNRLRALYTSNAERRCPLPARSDDDLNCDGLQPLRPATSRARQQELYNSVQRPRVAGHSPMTTNTRKFYGPNAIFYGKGWDDATERARQQQQQPQPQYSDDHVELYR